MKLTGARYGLSFLFAAMTLAAIPLAWRANAVSRQNSAIATLTNSGIHVGFSKSGPLPTSCVEFFGGDVVEVVLFHDPSASSKELSPELLRSLDDFPDLERLHIYGFELTPELVDALSGSTEMKGFVWVMERDFRIASSDDGARPAPIDVEPSETVIAALSKRYPNLEVVELTGLPFTDDDLVPLANLPHLKTIRIREGQFDGRFLSSLRELPLEKLELSSDRFSLEGFARLQQLRRLRYVDLSGNRFSASVLDAAIELDYVETLAFGIEAGPLPEDKMATLSNAGPPGSIGGFSAFGGLHSHGGWYYHRSKIWPMP